jgi:hypothetical protein
LGNAVTGRGNIKESQLHGRKVTQKVVDEFLAWNPEDYQMIFDKAKENANEKVFAVQKHLRKKPVLSTVQIDQIHERIKALQTDVGYTNYASWITKHLPPRLENMVDDS